ncbi:NAD-binding protein [Fomitopsis schrenkii]|uniref:NAD-binding protein n=1 Tax=Fomitopsis schrenkii TaxID=2126942 RepID=S8EQW0_FOMSC|nr:NAD-binding protein [Fomitopsis schrenkii]
MAAPTQMLRRVALVTGAAGARGIGCSIALRLAKDGLNVAVSDLSSMRHQLDDVVSEINSTAASGQRAVAVTGDVSIEGDVEAMVASVAEQLGGLDVMVANAGIHRYGRLADPGSGCVEGWDETMLINLRGVMLSYRYAAMQMIRQGRGGRIIGASSIAGKRGLDGGLSAYAASKFGVRGLTQSAALELAKHNITVNAYAPGYINTDLRTVLRDMTPDMRTDAITGSVDRIAYLGLPPNMPTADPEVIASLVSYLAKPEAYFITGQSINVDGGFYFD